MKLLTPISLIISLLIFTPDIISQNRISNQVALFPQEKIHLHTDRSMYVPGETIWFKAYVVDAFSHQSPTQSMYVYVELINSSDSLLYRVMVCQDKNGLFFGRLFLADYLPEGTYTLRAYTRFLENLGDDYFFKKPVWITNFKKNVTSDVPLNPSEGELGELELSFFPEGGYLTEGAICRVAFKAVNQQGSSVPVTGELIDGEGNTVTEINTVFAGMGSFVFKPEAGGTYFLRCKDRNQQEKQFRLPPAEKTISLCVSFQDNHIISINRSPDIPKQPLFLMIHNKGHVLHYAAWDHSRTRIAVSNEQLPSGINHILLLNEDNHPISERLIFNKSFDQANLLFSLDKTVYTKREKVMSEILVTDTEGVPLSGHVSVAVTDNKDLPDDTLNTITASLLISSELKGYIESPGYYLQDNLDAESALEHLMLTHGWRRYDISEVLKGNYRLPSIQYEEFKEIVGTVKTRTTEKPVVNGEVSLFSSAAGSGKTVTDSAGVFRFQLHYPDSVRFFIHSKNRIRQPATILTLQPETFPLPKSIPVSLPAYENTDNRNQIKSSFIEKASKRAIYDEKIRELRLEEVIVFAPRKTSKRDEARTEFWANASSDRTFYRERFSLGGVPNATQFRALMAGKRFSLLFIDGIELPLPEDILDLISVDDIESVDYFSKYSPRTAIFGSHGADGAISITTRRGERTHNNDTEYADYVSYMPLGYQKPIEFYTPNYKVPDYRTTIYWKPDVILSDKGIAAFDFHTADFPTSYSIVIEGMTTNGKIIRKIEKIEVK